MDSILGVPLVFRLWIASVKEKWIFIGRRPRPVPQVFKGGKKEGSSRLRGKRQRKQQSQSHDEVGEGELDIVRITNT